MKVGILGWGAIGSWIGGKLYSGSLSGVTLEAVASRNYRLPAPVKCIEPLELGECVDIVIEAAGHEAVKAYVPGLLEQGIRVVLVSTGALRDQGLYDELAKMGGDRLILSTGAIGGVDIVRACCQAGDIGSITLSTTKPSVALERPWMSAEMIGELREGRKVVECYRGSALHKATCSLAFVLLCPSQFGASQVVQERDLFSSKPKPPVGHAVGALLHPRS